MHSILVARSLELRIPQSITYQNVENDVKPPNKSVEEIFAKSNINLSYIPIKDKLYGIYEKFNIAKVGKEPWQKIEERQKKIQRKYYGALKNFIDKYNVLFKIMLAWQK